MVVGACARGGKSKSRVARRRDRTPSRARTTRVARDDDAICGVDFCDDCDCGGGVVGAAGVECVLKTHRAFSGFWGYNLSWLRTGHVSLEV